jgi:Predicted transcriptional regulators
MADLDHYRRAAVKGIKKLREERRYTQAEFSKLLGLSQQQYSKIERGGGSFSAEQFLFLLDRFTLPLNYFVETKSSEQDDVAVLQNALAALGASNLREVQGIFIPEKLGKPNEAIFETLAVYQSSRLIAALAPVVVKNIQRVNFAVVEKKLRESGHQNRLWWVLDNTLTGIRKRLDGAFLPRDEKLRYRHAETTLRAVLSLKSRALESSPNAANHQREDIFDEGISTQKTLDSLRAKNDPLSNKWNILTRLTQGDFEEALKNTEKS